MNTGTHWTQDEIDDDKDYQIEVLEKRVKELEAIKLVNKMLLDYLTSKDLVSREVMEWAIYKVEEMCADLKALGGDSNE